jgi:hypothetical protein
MDRARPWMIGASPGRTHILRRAQAPSSDWAAERATLARAARDETWERQGELQDVCEKAQADRKATDATKNDRNRAPIAWSVTEPASFT